jgi:SAM-dependent methyltransferase
MRPFDDALSTEQSMAGCFLCKKESTRTIWKERAYEGRLCSCGMVYAEPSPPPGAIDVTREAHPPEFYSYSAGYKAEWMARHCPPGRLLEVGCGDGFFLEAARARGYEVFGLEPHPDRARRVREWLGVDVHRGLLEDGDLPIKGFDVVYHCDMLAHFPDPIRCLRLMASTLREGGVLCLEVGILGGISTFWYRLIGEIGLGPHRWLYSRQALDALFRRADLAVAHVQCFGLGPYVLLDKLGRTAVAAAFRLASLVPPLRARMSREEVDRLHARFLCFVHYRVGLLAPAVGPLKLLIVARPRGHAART